jgi:Peptidase family M28
VDARPLTPPSLRDENGLKMIEDYLERLSRFPHRMSGTTQDRQAADWIRDALAGLGLEPSTIPFSVPGRLGFGLALNLLFGLAAYVLSWRSPGPALALLGICLLSLWGELTFSFHLLRRIIPPHASCNVEAAVRSRDAARRSVLILAHHDTPGTGLLFRGVAGRLGPVLRRLPPPFNRANFPPFIAALGLAVGLVLGRTDWGRTLGAGVAAVSAVLLAVILFLVVQWGLSRPSPGANDNGSGLAVLLELAERLSRKPTQTVSVRVLATGAEETGFFGIKRFLRDHPRRSDAPSLIINLDSIGGGDLSWAVAESTLRGIRYPQAGLDVLAAVEAEGGLPGLPRVKILSPTDAGPIARRGLPVLTLIGLENGFSPPNLHRSTDTYDRLDLAVLRRAADIVEGFVRALEK